MSFYDYTVLDRKGNDIRWNFTKFIVDKDGKVVARFEPTDKMNDVRAFVEGLLK